MAEAVPAAETATLVCGYVGGVTLAICLVPQLFVMWRRRSADDISLPWLILYCIGRVEGSGRVHLEVQDLDAVSLAVDEQQGVAFAKGLPPATVRMMNWYTCSCAVARYQCSSCCG